MNNSIRRRPHLLKHERFTIDLLFGNKLSEWDEMDKSELVQLHHYCGKNGLSALMYSVLLEKSPVHAPFFKAGYMAGALRNEQLIDVSRKILNELSLSDIKVLPLKGIYLSQSVYSDSSTRPMSDIDILIHVDQVDRVMDVIKKCGGEVPSHHRSDPSDHHLPPFYINRHMLELHLGLFPANAKYAIPIDDIWEHAVPWGDNPHLLKMNPNQLFIYLSLHIYYTYLRGGLRLSWFYDLFLLLHHEIEGISIQETTHWLDKWNAHLPFSKVMSQLAFLLGESNPFVNRFADHKHQKDVIRALIYFRESGQQINVSSYQLAWERLGQTKGFGNKMRFVGSHLFPSPHHNGLLKTLFYAVFRLFRIAFITAGMLIFKLLQKTGIK